MKKRILSGIQPSGQLHLGNYAGAIRQFVDMQGEYEVYIFVASYHALTSTRDPEVLRNNIRQIVIDYIAFGLDPKQANIYLQHDAKIKKIISLGQTAGVKTSPSAP